MAQQATRTDRTERPRAKRRRSAMRLGTALTLAALVAASASSPHAAGAPAAAADPVTDVGQGSEIGPVTFATKVERGKPVRMNIVTEASKKEFAGKDATGQGIDVALIDSGVSLVDGLDQPGKVVFGPDLSNEGAQPSLANVDTFGHGTHLAGIINGDDGDEVLGVAPDSRLVSVKVAGASGETNIAQVIAGIDWVVEHRNDNGLDIRVLNLSLGVEGVKTNQGDPLSAAVERAWDAGIVVVAAVGNRGNEHGGVDSPAVSPYVIAVGATERYDSDGKDDEIAAWSSGGNEYRVPDVVAPGRSIMSFRVPGSTLDQKYPSAVVDEDYFVGSGSSQSTAVVTGFVAAMLSRYPDLTNDQVKYLLEDNAKEIKKVEEYVQGEGKIEPKKSMSAAKKASKAPTQHFEPALAADGSDGIVAPMGATWSGGTWNGATWSGGTWSGATWSGATWSGATWSGATWSGATWSGATWAGATWAGATWASGSWS